MKKTILLGFGLAVLAHFLGQSSAIGAFIMGMIIASSKHSEQITEKILPLRDFFGVIFGGLLGSPRPSGARATVVPMEIHRIQTGAR